MSKKYRHINDYENEIIEMQNKGSNLTYLYPLF